MALDTFTDQHATEFLECTHRAYLGIAHKTNPQECIRHIYSTVLPESADLGPISLLEISPSWPLVAPIDETGLGVASQFRDTPWLNFVFSVKSGEIDQQLREMTLPRGAVALSLSFEAFVELLHPHTGQPESGKVRQTVAVMRGGATTSLITHPNWGTDRASALCGGTIELLRKVVERTKP
jgi:hypothetical protein